MLNERREIQVARPAFLGNERKYVEECLETTWISSIGRFIGAFEHEFARLCGVRYAIACNTGTSAVHLALLGMNVGIGDQVIVPSLTFIATANAVRYCGAEPIFVDSEPRTMNLDPELIERAITPQTRGIVAVHLYGHPVDMDPIREIAARHSLFIIEDAAEAHGARYKGRFVGALSEVAAFSFFGNKILSTGEGGMVTTDDPDVAERVRLLRGQGMDPSRRYWFPEVGYNYRMTNIEAALGLAQVEKADEHFGARRRVSQWYYRHLGSCQELMQLPIEEKWAHHAFWMYTIVLRPWLNRDSVMRGLAAKGIQTRPVFYPLHTLPPYRQAGQTLSCAESIAARGVSLPTHALLSEDDVIYVSENLAKICEKSKRVASQAASR